MGINDFSPWGGVLVVLLVVAAWALIRLVDVRMLNKLWRVRLHLPQLPVRVLLLVAGAVLVGSLLVAGCLLLAFPVRLCWPVAVVVCCALVLSVPRSMETYLRSLKATAPHRRYMTANGASHLETVIPSVRRALRAALLPLLWQRSSAMPVAMLFLLCGLLMAGAGKAAALVAVGLTWAAVIAAAVLVSVLAMWASDRCLFDKFGNLTVPADKP